MKHHQRRVERHRLILAVTILFAALAAKISIAIVSSLVPHTVDAALFVDIANTTDYAVLAVLAHYFAGVRVSD